MDFANMLGSFLTGDTAQPTGNSWWLGMIVHFINGAVIFPLIYAFLLYNWLPGPNWMKGTIWGLTLWFVSQTVVSPMMGGGVFSSAAADRTMMVLASFLLHFIYGAALGWMAGPQAVHEVSEPRERHA